MPAGAASGDGEELVIAYLLIRPRRLRREFSVKALTECDARKLATSWISFSLKILKHVTKHARIIQEIIHTVSMFGQMKLPLSLSASFVLTRFVLQLQQMSKQFLQVAS